MVTLNESNAQHPNSEVPHEFEPQYKFVFGKTFYYDDAYVSPYMGFPELQAHKHAIPGWYEPDSPFRAGRIDDGILARMGNVRSRNWPWYIYEGFKTKKDPEYKEFLRKKEEVVILGYYDKKPVQLRATRSFVTPRSEFFASENPWVYLLGGAIIASFITAAVYFLKKYRVTFSAR